MLAGWACGAIDRDSRERTVALPAGLTTTTTDDHTAALGHRPPVSRLHQLTGNNLVGSYA